MKALNLTCGSDEDEGDSLTYYIKTDTNKGSLIIDGDTAYVPLEFLWDDFEYYVVDSGGLTSNISLGTITVYAVNDIPEVGGLDVSGTEDTYVYFSSGTDIVGYIGL